MGLKVFLGMKGNRDSPKQRSPKPKTPTRKGFVEKVRDGFQNHLPEKVAETFAEHSMKLFCGAVGAVFAGIFLVKGDSEHVAVAPPTTAPAPVVFNFNVVNQVNQPSTVHPQPISWSGSTGDYYTPDLQKSESTGVGSGSDRVPAVTPSYVPNLPKSGSSGAGHGAERFANLGYDNDDRDRSIGDEEGKADSRAPMINFIGGDHYTGLVAAFHRPNEDVKPVSYSSYTPGYSYYTPSGGEAVNQNL